MLSAAQYRVYSLVSRRLAPPLEAACIVALTKAVRAAHVEIVDGAWILTPKGKAEFVFARECL